MPNKLEINATTGVKASREMNPEELAQYEKDIEARKEFEKLEEQREAKLESAKAKLTALGLDEAEVQAILGL